MNLDYIGAVGCLFMSFMAFTLHAISTKDQTVWVTYPFYLRWAMFIVGTAALYRGVSFIQIAQDPAHASITVEGLVNLFALDYLFGALVYWRMFTKKLPAGAWKRVEHVERLEKMGFQTHTTAHKKGETKA